MKAWYRRFCENNNELVIGLIIGLSLPTIIILYRTAPVILGGMWGGFKLSCEACLAWFRIIGELLRAIF